MANLNTKIEWTDATWNVVTGCTKVSAGCKHCYAERLFPRVYGNTTVRDVSMSNLLGEPTDRQRKFTDVKLHPDRLEQPLHWKKPRMIFVNSMSDLFHEDVPFEFIDKIFASMAISPNHTFQILTKRPERMLKYFFGTRDDAVLDQVSNLIDRLNLLDRLMEIYWPLPNAWLGISCENQETADERIPILLQVPAPVRFLSCEPLLDRIDLAAFLGDLDPINDECETDPVRHGIDWVIVGGESGPGYRPMNLDWARQLRDQCKSAGVPFFFKQTAGKKQITEDLMIREYPTCT